MPYYRELDQGNGGYSKIFGYLFVIFSCLKEQSSMFFHSCQTHYAFNLPTCRPLTVQRFFQELPRSFWTKRYIPRPVALPFETSKLCWK